MDNSVNSGNNKITLSQGSGNEFDPLSLAVKNPVSQPPSKYQKEGNRVDSYSKKQPAFPKPSAKPLQAKVPSAQTATGWDDADWNFEDDLAVDIKSKEYQNKNLNKLSNGDLQKEKRKMDAKFNENALKPNDPGFVYDKVVDFSREQRQTNPWDNNKDQDSYNEDEEYTEDWDM